MLLVGPANILTQDLWRDEAFSVLLSLKNLGQIVSITASDFNPPLYYLFLHFWTKVFGIGEVSVRLPSLGFLILSAYGVFLVGRKLFSRDVAILSSLCVLFNPFLFYYGFEARMYTMLALFSIFSFYFLVSERWCLFIFAAILGLYTHSFMIFSLLGGVLAYLIFNRPKERGKLVLSLALVSGGFLPWVKIILSQVRSAAGSFWLTKPGVVDIIQTLGRLLITPTSRHYSLWVLLGLCLLLFILYSSFFSYSCRLHRRELISLAVWALAPIFLSFLVSYFVPIFLPRYLIFVVLPLSLITVYVLLQHPFKLVLVGTFVGLCLVRSFAVWQRPEKFPIGERVVAISRVWQGEPVVCESILNFFEVQYYLLRLKPRASEAVSLLASGFVSYAGGALVGEGSVVEKIPDPPYFLVRESGEIEFLE